MNVKRKSVNKIEYVFTIYPTVGGGGDKINISRIFYGTYMGDLVTKL